MRCFDSQPALPGQPVLNRFHGQNLTISARVAARLVTSMKLGTCRIWSADQLEKCSLSFYGLVVPCSSADLLSLLNFPFVVYNFRYSCLC